MEILHCPSDLRCAIWHNLKNFLFLSPFVGAWRVEELATRGFSLSLASPTRRRL
jgi:hypothetical protein